MAGLHQKMDCRWPRKLLLHQNKNIDEARREEPSHKRVSSHKDILYTQKNSPAMPKAWKEWVSITKWKWNGDETLQNILNHHNSLQSAPNCSQVRKTACKSFKNCSLMKKTACKCFTMITTSKKGHVDNARTQIYEAPTQKKSVDCTKTVPRSFSPRFSRWKPSQRLTWSSTPRTIALIPHERDRKCLEWVWRKRVWEQERAHTQCDGVRIHHTIHYVLLYMK